MTTSSAAETHELGRAIGAAALAGDVLLLAGAFGAGKTVLTQGIAEGLAVSDDVVSPTFVLVRQYAGRLELVHADLYRLETSEEIAALGLLDLSAEGVLVVEWADRAPWLAPQAARVTITSGEGDARQVRLSGGGDHLRAAFEGAALP